MGHLRGKDAWKKGGKKWNKYEEIWITGKAGLIANRTNEKKRNWEAFGLTKWEVNEQNAPCIERLHFLD